MRTIIAANWKMHKTAAEAVDFCRKIRPREGQFKGVEVLICPPFTSLAAVGAALAGSGIKLGAQNVHWEDQGAFTGEVAASMLLELGVEYVIVGHSERRHLMGEDDEVVNRKLQAALSRGLKAILCLGETEAQREKGLTEEVIKTKLDGALSGVDPAQAAGLVVAYEPVWAIGTGKAAHPGDAETAANLIREHCGHILGPEVEAGLRIQYGGSVNAGNISSFMALDPVNGALVGGASLDPDSFSTLVLAAREAKKS